MRVVAIAVALVSATVLALSSAHTAPPAEPPPEMFFAMARDTLAIGGVRLTNGASAKVSDWPTLVFAEITEADGQVASCTGVLVGPRVLLTAGHCVTRFMSTTLKTSALRVDGREPRLDCTLYPYYARAEAPGDFALCLIGRDDEALPRTLTTMEFEVIEDVAELSPGETVWLIGYGCTDLSYDSISRWSYTRAPHRLNLGADMIETASGEMVTTRSLRGRDPMLCRGDSGGPVMSGAAIADAARPRFVRGINSHVTPERRADGGWDIVSHMGPTGSSTFTTWAKQWAQMHGDPIVCGINTEQGVFPCRA